MAAALLSHPILSVHVFLGTLGNAVIYLWMLVAREMKLFVRTGVRVLTEWVTGSTIPANALRSSMVQTVKKMLAFPTLARTMEPVKVYLDQDQLVIIQVSTTLNVTVQSSILAIAVNMRMLV